MALTARQKKFAAVFDGNQTEAARAAGYTGDEATLASTGYRLMRNDEVRALIEKRDAGLLEQLVLNVAEMQATWTRHAIDPKLPIESRLSALRDLAKSQGAFVHRHEHSVGKSLEELLRESMAEEPKK